MRTRRTLVALGALLACLASSAIGRATPSLVVVRVFDNTFVNKIVDDASAGDTLTFQFEQGTHDAVSYSSTAFNSRTKHEGETYTITFGGGVVRYRCTLHSTMNWEATPPICSGMCGIISDTPVDVTPPAVAISAPTNRAVLTVLPAVSNKGSATFTVGFAGTASDNVGVYGGFVRVYDSAGRGSEFPMSCDACPGGSINWSSTAALQPGMYTAEAIAADPSGNRATSPRIQFVVA